MQMMQSLEQELLTVLIINIIISFDDTWLINQPTVVSGLLHIWVSPDFHDHHRRIVRLIFTYCLCYFSSSVAFPVME